jgi:uncharacterized protein YwgA
MEPRLIALQLFLKQLGVSSEIESLEDRVRVQKAVYLGQLSGVDFGYRFSWYLRGPYSTKLTTDYFELEEAIRLREEDSKKMELKTSIKKKLDAIAPLMKKPNTVTLEIEGWLELVASYHFLRKVRGYSNREATAKLEEEKPSLVEFVKICEQSLINVGLLKSPSSCA